jgi:hypothetical protein
MVSLPLNISKRNPKIHITRQRAAVVITQEMSIEGRACVLIYEKAATIADPTRRARFVFHAFLTLRDPNIQILDFAALLAKAEEPCAAVDDNAGLARLLADGGTALAPIPKAPGAMKQTRVDHGPHAQRAPPGALGTPSNEEGES